jgi:hypothetical protein
MIAVCMVLAIVSVCPATAADHAPLWELDLRPLGYVDATDFIISDYWSTVNEPVFFLDEQTLAITFLVRNNNSGLSTRESSGAPYVTMTSLIDVATGKLRTKKIWASDAYNFKIAGATGSRIVVLDRWGARLYDKSFEQLAEHTFSKDTVDTDGPPSNKRAPRDLNQLHWRLYVSPTGKTAVAVHWGGYSAMVHVLETNRFNVFDEYKQDTYFDGDASDSSFVYDYGDYPNSTELIVCKRPFRSQSVISARLHRCTNPKFVNNDRLLFFSGCSQLRLFDSEGKQVAEKDLGGYDGGRVRPSRAGNRFAISLSKDKPLSFDRGYKSIDPHIVVYDTDSLKPVFELRDERMMKRFWDPLDYALSPDGRLLAVLYRSQLVLYRVDEPGKP